MHSRKTMNEEIVEEYVVYDQDDNLINLNVGFEVVEDRPILGQTWHQPTTEIKINYIELPTGEAYKLTSKQESRLLEYLYNKYV